MNSDICFALASAGVGIVSGWYFCRDAVASTAAEIHAAAWQSWSYEDGASAPGLISEAANQFAGGVLLVVAFVLQVFEKLAPSVSVPFWAALSAPFLAMPLAWVLGGVVYRKRRERLAVEVKALHEHQQ
jgi:hypothetical protein